MQIITHTKKKNPVVCTGPQGLFHLTIYILKEKRGGKKKSTLCLLLLPLANYIPK